MPTRRIFLRNSALAMIGVGTAPIWLKRALYAADAPAARKKILVAIFQRGAADGLNIVVPHGEARYYSLRPTIAIPRPATNDTENSAVDLDGFFGLHPALAPLKPLYDARHLAIVHAAGSPDPTRSHFDAQDYMESGTPASKPPAMAGSTARCRLSRATRRRFVPWPWGLYCRGPCAAATAPSPSKASTSFKSAMTALRKFFRPCTPALPMRSSTAPAARPSRR